MVVAASLAQAVDVQIGLNFTGSTLHLNAENTPPNANGASGPSHYVEIVNGRYAVYDKANGSVATSSTDMSFWTGAGISFSAGLEVSDPRVLFDPRSGRWFASGLDLRRSTFEENRLLLAVSKTSNPLDGWNGLAFDPDPGSAFFSDFPTLGIDANGVYLGANFFDQAGTLPSGRTVVSIPKADLLTNSPTVANRTAFGVLPAGVGNFTTQPAVNFAQSASPEILLSQGPFIHHNLKDTKINNAAGPGQATLGSTVNISAPAFSNPTALHQPDSTATLSNIDNRIGAAVYEVNGVLFAAHVTTVNSRSAIRWYRLDAATDTLIESGLLADPTADFSFPSIAANQNGAIVIGFNKSSATEFVSSYAVVGETLGGVTTFASPVLLKAGTANYHYFPVNGFSRWGDFSSTNVDPTDPNVFWTNQEFVSAQDVWSTQITQIRIVPEPSVGVLLMAIAGLALRRGAVRFRL